MTGDVFDARNLTGPLNLNLVPGYFQFITGSTFAFAVTGFEIFRFGETDNVVTAEDSGSGVNIEAMGGQDRLNGSDHADRLNGGEGADSLLGGLGGDTLLGEAGNDSLSGGIGLDSLSGGADTDRLDGGADDDTLDGGAGADLLIGGAGADHLIGGDQIDVADYRTASAGVALSLETGGTGGDAAGDVFMGVENVIGSAHADALTGDGNRNVLHGGLGADTISGGAGADALHGGAGADLLRGDDGLDFAYYSQSRAGVYINLDYGFGFAGDADGDTLIGIEGVIGSRFNDILSGDFENNYLYGEAGNDRIDGWEGDDRLRGGSGADTMCGGWGQDSAYYTTSDSAVQIDLSLGTASGGHAEGDLLCDIEDLVGSAWDDSLTGDWTDNRLHGVNGDDLLSGQDGNDILVGGNGNDVLFGDDGSDRLIAGDGADRLVGGFGTDQMWGGTGADVFVFADGDSGAGSFKARDSVLDFNAGEGDLIDVSGIAGLIGLSTGPGFSGTGPDMFSLQIGSITRLSIDVDGDGIEDMEIDLRGLHSLTDAHFLFD